MYKHTDWRFLLKWLVQTSAAAGFFLISLGAFVLCGWGLLSHLGWLPDLAGVSALQNLAPHIQSCRIYHYVKLAADWFEALCARNYSYCIILLSSRFSSWSRPGRHCSTGLRRLVKSGVMALDAPDCCQYF